MPSITLQNRQRAVALETRWLRRFARLALPQALEISADGKFALRALNDVAVTLVSDRAIARLHEQFMAIPGPTDVLTFDHGEIVISAETARANAARYGHGAEEEIALYTVHGLLHLNGFEDAAPPDAAAMRTAQTRIWRACLAQLPSPRL